MTNDDDKILINRNYKFVRLLFTMLLQGNIQEFECKILIECDTIRRFRHFFPGLEYYLEWSMNGSKHGKPKHKP